MPFKTFLVNKFNSSKFRVNGLIPSTHLPNKLQLCQTFREHIVYRAEQLPPKVDLRSDMTPVEDQSRIGSCAANCLAGAYEYLTKKANGRNTDVSRLFIYYNARVKDQKTQNPIDSGCTMTSAIEALEEMGTCLETLWPYDISRVNSRPNDQSYDEAKRHKITEALRVNINLYEMKSCLAQGFPFAFGLKLYTTFDQASKTGVVPMPAYGDDGRQAHGSHALLAVGYSDQSRAFIVRNSWGEQWGDKGYCYIPYDYMTNQNLCFDAWAVRKLATDNFGQEHWDIEDIINYSRIKKNDRLPNNIIDDNSEIIETIDDDDYNNDYNRKDDFDQPWNPYQSYEEYQFSQNDNNNNFNEPWNPYRSYKENNFSNGFNKNNHKSGSNNFWNPYQTYRGNTFSRYDYTNQYQESFGRNSSSPPFDQFQANDNLFGFSNGYLPTDQFNRNLVPPSSYPGYQQYGSSYGYTPPFNNNYFNSYF